MTQTQTLHLRMSPQGKIVIPAEVRRHLGMHPGEQLVARVEGSQLVLERQANILRRLQDRFAALPDDLRLSELLIAQRRQLEDGAPGES